MADFVDDVADSSVAFLYKTMLERDPHKRRVKPVQKHLIQLNFGGLEDSSDDSDFEVPAHGASDGSDNDLDSDAEDDVNAGVSDSGSESGLEECEGEDEEASCVAGVGATAKGHHDAGLSLGELVQKAELSVHDLTLKTGSEDTMGSSSSRIKLTICCVCLGDNSEEDDEIVECDGCGVSVHEGCYGIAESQSVASTESSASTEPWFCDACKAGVKPHCELCPNEGGIYKETDAVRWVHIVCALYIPGVAFGDVDRLSPVTLFEMPYTKWGAKECSLCDDERFSRTGVCISCDAGMCRAYFHVTCAQREGLLSEASPDEEIADPFYAYCRQHGDKMVVRAKRRNYMAIQSHYRAQSHHLHDLDEKEQGRVQRKLTRHRQKYLVTRAQRQSSWGQVPVVTHGDPGARGVKGSFGVKRRLKYCSPPHGAPLVGGVPKEKIPRMLTSNPSATRRLMRKAELLGINTQVPAGCKGDPRKKGHVGPALSVPFVSYYLDRNMRITNMKTHLQELLVQGNKLREQEARQRARYDAKVKDVAGLRETNLTFRQKAQDIWRLLEELGGKPLPLPEVVKAKKVVRSSSKRDTPRSPPGIIHQCGLCQKTTDQHLLACCDTCHLYYHLGCLDPPLTRMPKKTKQQGWQCSECGSSSIDEATKKDRNPNAPRRLRDKIKEPMKFTPIEETVKASRERSRKKGRRVSKAAKRPRVAEDFPLAEHGAGDWARPPLSAPGPGAAGGGAPGGVGPLGAGDEDVQMDREMPILKKERPCRLPKPAKFKDVRTDCCVCNLEGDNNNLVRCDECTLCYHFHCLDPPLRKSPKQRGYAWHCTACDPTEGEPILPSKNAKRKRRDNIPPPKKLELPELPPPPPPQPPPQPLPKQSSENDDDDDDDMVLEGVEHESAVRLEDADRDLLGHGLLGDEPRDCLSDSDAIIIEDDTLPPRLHKESTD